MKKSTKSYKITFFCRFLKLLCWLAELTLRTGPSDQSPQPDFTKKLANCHSKVLMKNIYQKTCKPLQHKKILGNEKFTKKLANCHS